MNQVPSSPVNCIEDSVSRAHDSAVRAIRILDLLWGDLLGAIATDNAAEPAACGLVYEADSLATKLSMICDRLEDTRSRIARPKVTQAMSSNAAIANQLPRTHY